MIRDLVRYLLGGIRPAQRRCLFHDRTHTCWRERRYLEAF